MKSKIKVVFVYLVTSILLAISLFPIYWTINTAFKNPSEFFRFPPTFIPNESTLKNFSDAWNWGGNKGIFDSALVALVTTGIAMIIGIFAAYSIARWETGGPNLSMFILTMRMLPPVVPAISYYLIIKKGFLLFPPFDSHLLLICLYSLFNIPFVVWIMKSFISEISPQLEEAAQIAGVSRLRAFWDVILPLAKPGLVAVASFCIFFSWNEFLFALFLTSTRVRKLPKVIPFLVTEQEPMWGAINSVCLFSIIPMIIMAVFLQKYLVRGLSFGAVRG